MKCYASDYCQKDKSSCSDVWIGEYFATMAWNMGYKILMYSGEMSTAMVGFRFDTLNKHFSNMGLLNGSGTLGKKPDTDGAKYLQEDYEKYITQLQQKSGFIVVTPDDFEGRIPLAYMDFSKAGNSTPLRERESEPQIPAF